MIFYNSKSPIKYALITIELNDFVLTHIFDNTIFLFPINQIRQSKLGIS